MSVIVIGIDRITVNVGQKFDSENHRHIDKVIKAVAARHGEGFEIENFEPATGKAVLRRENRSAIASHTATHPSRCHYLLARQSVMAKNDHSPLLMRTSAT